MFYLYHSAHSYNASNKLKNNENKPHGNYNLIKNTTQKKSTIDTSIEDEIKDYIRLISDENFESTDPLLFWKLNENRFKELSKLARKYLGVPASSAAVERMFSIAGHVFHTKRRRMGQLLFSALVFLKLNEDLLVKIFLN